MIKSTIELRNGATMKVECSNAREFSGIMAELGGMAKKPAKKQKDPEEEEIEVAPGARSTKGKKRSEVLWSDHDVAGIGKIVAANLNITTDGAIRKMARKYIKEEGENRNRTKATIATTTSILKGYISGANPNRISQRMTDALNNAGVRPVAQKSQEGQSVKSYLPNLQEA